MTSKYEPLAIYLRSIEGNKIHITFKEVEEIIDGSLPDSAWEHRAWWSNNESHTSSRNGWLAGGWKTSNVDMEKQELDFIRIKQPPAMRGLRASIYATDDDLFGEIDRQDLQLLLQSARTAGGAENLRDIIRAIEQYIHGEILETELGRLLRQRWPR
jgi:hypothetical protein